MTGFAVERGKLFGSEKIRFTDTRTLVTIKKFSLLWVAFCIVKAERVDRQFEPQLRSLVRTWAEEGRTINLGPVADVLSDQILRLAYSGAASQTSKHLAARQK